MYELQRRRPTIHKRDSIEAHLTAVFIRRRRQPPDRRPHRLLDQEVPPRHITPPRSMQASRPLPPPARYPTTSARVSK